MDTTGGARRDRLAIMNLNSRISVRRLKVIGLALLCDAAVFIGTLLLMMTGMLGDEPWLYYPIVFVCIVPLGIGWILSAVHLATTAGADANKAQWWWRLLFAGPFAPGWYLSQLGEG